MTEGLKGQALTTAFEEALAGKPDRLYVQLGVVSGLPGTRANIPVALQFAHECVARGARADRLAFTMAQLSPEAAPGASEREFLPVCGVLAIGSRAAADAGLRRKVIAILHDAAEDVRFRVREVVPVALAKIGGVMGDALVAEVAPWMDGFFQAAAVLLAMADPTWLPALEDAEGVLARLDEAYALARDAPRAASRYPGRKALVDALAIAPGVLATRFGVPVFDHLVTWSNTEMPELRAAIQASIAQKKLAGRYASDIERVRAALDASVPPPRDPTLIVQGMRGRGKKRSRR